MKLTSQSFRNGAVIPERCAFAKLDPRSHAVLSDDKNPELSWTDVPAVTKSLVTRASSAFGRDEVLAAIAGRVLAPATLTGTYTLNPKLR